MPQTVKCVKCGADVQVATVAPGVKVRCATCGGTLILRGGAPGGDRPTTRRAAPPPDDTTDGPAVGDAAPQHPARRPAILPGKNTPLMRRLMTSRASGQAPKGRATRAALDRDAAPSHLRRKADPTVWILVGVCAVAAIGAVVYLMSSSKSKADKTVASKKPTAPPPSTATPAPAPNASAESILGIAPAAAPVAAPLAAAPAAVAPPAPAAAPPPAEPKDDVHEVPIGSDESILGALRRGGDERDQLLAQIKAKPADFIPRIIPMVGDEDTLLARAAARFLKDATGQDFGAPTIETREAVKKKWEEWWAAQPKG